MAFMRGFIRVVIYVSILRLFLSSSSTFIVYSSGV